MMTLGTLFLFIGVLLALWVRTFKAFPVQARYYLWLAPFFPLISLFNHNFDGDTFGHFIRVAPHYVVIGCLLVSLARHRGDAAAGRWGIEGGCLAGYALLSLVQACFSIDPLWVLFTWSWSVPGCFLFLLAGRSTSTAELARDPYARWAVLGFLGVNLSLIAYGMLIGKAANLFHTRNFGSVFASTAMLVFLLLYGGIVWLQVRASVLWSYVFWTASATAVVLSLSRTAIIVALVYGGFMLTLRIRQLVRQGIVLGLTGGSLLIGTLCLGGVIDLDEQLLGNWGQRFHGGEVMDAVEDAMDVRRGVFVPVWERILTGNPFLGVGFGTFRHYSDYTDAHNLFATEAFENGLLAAIFLVFAMGIPRALGGLREDHRRPLAIALLGFVVLAHTTGAMFSYRALEHYYTAYPGWAYFFIVGHLGRIERPPTPSPPTATAQDVSAPSC